MDRSDEFWLSYLRTQNAREDRRLLQKENLQEQADRVVKVSLKEQEELQKALLKCDHEIKRRIAPLFRFPMAHSVLYGILCEERQQSEAGHIERFNERLKSTQLQDRLDELIDLVEENGPGLTTAFEKTLKTAEPHSVSLEAVRREEEEASKRTWKDIPPDELAERLSKGEIIGRDEWIPGISKGRRKLLPQDLEEHLKFGKRIQQEGNDFFRKGDYSMALTRYTQGTHLLDWVESTDEDKTREIDELLLIFYRNQCQAALTLGEYQTAKSAATKALELDEHDGKALYRRGQANILLGDLPAAKSDFMAILKSPYTSTESKMASQGGMKQLRQIVSKWKKDAGKLYDGATQEHLFSADRPEGILSAISSEDEYSFPQRQQRIFEFPESASAVPIPMRSSNEVEESTPFLDLDDVKALLEDLLDAYTNDVNQKLLNSERKSADYDERRFLIRSKKLLPELIQPILDRWGFKGDDFHQQKREMEKCIGYWRCRDEEVKSLAEDVFKSFLGDLIDG